MCARAGSRSCHGGRIERLTLPTPAQDEELLRYLADVRRGTTTRKLKTIPGHIVISVAARDPDERVGNSLTPSLGKVKPWTEGSEEGVCREMQEFAPGPVYRPHSEYRHMLFVYPQLLNFANRGSSRARNIAVRAEFLATDAQPAEPLPLFYAQGGEPAAMGTSMTTPVTYHSKAPDFYTEIKLQLPHHVGQQHHVLFTFYHISCQVLRRGRRSLHPPRAARWQTRGRLIRRAGTQEERRGGADGDDRGLRVDADPRERRANRRRAAAAHSSNLPAGYLSHGASEVKCRRQEAAPHGRPPGEHGRDDRREARF